MTYIPDPLFRNGLEHYRKAAPASVWDRVEAGLDRKRRRSIWLKVAAGLALLMATSTVLWQYDQTDTVETEVAVGSQQSAVSSGQSTVGSQQLAVGSQKLAVGSRQSAVDSTQSAVSSPQSADGSLKTSQLNAIVERTVGELRCTEREYKDGLKAAEVSHMIVARAGRTSRNNHSDVVHGGLPVVERSRNETLRSTRQSAAVAELSHMDEGKQVEASAVSSQQLVVSNPKSVISSEEAQLITLIESEEIITELTSLNTIEGLVNDVIVEQKGTSITYTAEQVNTRFIKKDLPTQATPEKKNASGLQKVIDKAVELTNERTVYSELREKKNEWLSFNMLSNKTEANK